MNAENLDRIERCLAPGGTFRFASDVDAYVKWTLREVGRHGKLAWIGEGSRRHAGRHGRTGRGRATRRRRGPRAGSTAYLTFRKTG